MRRGRATATLLPLLLASLLPVGLGQSGPLAAQTPDPPCTDPAVVGPGLEGGDACQKAIDLFRYLDPQLGMLIAGGNATLGQGATLGGAGHFAIGLRMNVSSDLSIPTAEAAMADVGPARQGTMPVIGATGAFPAIDVAVGVFGGAELGPVRAGGIDLLVNVFFVPESALGILEGDENVAVSLDGGGVKLGYGARVGLIEETALTPGVALTFIRRDLPVFSAVYSGSVLGGGTADTLRLDDLALRTSAWRVVAGKRLGSLALAAGIGRDSYDPRVSIAYAVGPALLRARGGFPFERDVSVTNAFVDVGLDIGPLRLVGELGRTWDGAIVTFNSFDRPADDARSYGSAGLRVGI